MNLILALDQGTTSSRAIVFSREGAIAARAQRDLALSYPHPGWVEADPMALWSGVLAAARATVADVGAAHIDAIGIANQRETTVLWDRRTGEPLHNAIVWQDRRTHAACETLRAAGHADFITQATGLVLDPYFSATKLAWLLNHVPGARERAERGELCFGTVDSWLVYQLTCGRVHATEPSNASRTMLYNIHQGCWDQDLLELFNIPRALLPEVVPSSGVRGHSDAQWFGVELPIGGVAGDQQAATYGQDCVRPGMAKNTYGTGCFIMVNTGAKPAACERLLSTVGWSVDGRTDYLLEGSVFMGGAIVHWLRDLGVIGHSADIEALATSVADSGGVMLVPAFTGLGAPYWDAGARATLTGMSRSSGKAHIARAGLDAIALQCADVLQTMRQAPGVTLTELRVDGGASANDYLMQLQANLLGLPVLRPRVTETTALGAARLAALATAGGRDAGGGVAWQLERAFEPAWSGDRREATIARWRRAVEHARQWRTEDGDA
ncbi:MAG: glycerol kinase GlpK [Pseudomonadota bacterium]